MLAAPASAAPPLPSAEASFGRSLDAPPPAVRELDVLLPRKKKEIEPFSGNLEISAASLTKVVKAGAIAAALTYLGHNKLRFVSCVCDDNSGKTSGEFTISFELRPATLEELTTEAEEDEEAKTAFIHNRLNELWDEAEKKDGEEIKTASVRAFLAVVDAELEAIKPLVKGTRAMKTEAISRLKDLEARITDRCTSITWFKAKFDEQCAARAAARGGDPFKVDDTGDFVSALIAATKELSVGPGEADADMAAAPAELPAELGSGGGGVSESKEGGAAGELA